MTFAVNGFGTADMDILRGGGAANQDQPHMYMIYDVLVYLDRTNGGVAPHTADSLTSADGLVWTLKLRPNIRFSDDTPYDAAAVKFNIERFQDPANASSRQPFTASIKSMDVVDPLTLKFTMTSVNAVFPYSLSQISFMGSPTAIKTMGNDKFIQSPVGAGPFLLQSNTGGSQKVLVRNPKYWNAPLPYLDKVIFTVITDETQRANAFQAGQIDASSTVSNPIRPTYLAAGAAAYYAPANGGTTFMMNVKTKPFSDIRARQAVTMAIDRADLIKAVDEGQSPPMNSDFDQGSPYYDTASLRVGYDPVKAQQLFDTLAAENGGPLTIELKSGNSSAAQMNSAQYILGKLNTYRNIKVTGVTYLGSAPVLQAARSGDYTMLVYSAIWSDPDAGYIAFIDCGSISNFTGFCDPQVTALIADERKTLDRATRIADIKGIEKIYNDALPSWTLVSRVVSVYVKPSFQNVTLIGEGYPMFDQLWIKG